MQTPQHIPLHGQNTHRDAGPNLKSARAAEPVGGCGVRFTSILLSKPTNASFDQVTRPRGTSCLNEFGAKMPHPSTTNQSSAAPTPRRMVATRTGDIPPLMPTLMKRKEEPRSGLRREFREYPSRFDACIVSQSPLAGTMGPNNEDADVTLRVTTCTSRSEERLSSAPHSVIAGITYCWTRALVVESSH
jgi:hypothetical protein